MNVRTIAEINQYQSATINPSKCPDQIYELYSIPSFDSQYPEIIKGSEIGSCKVVVEEGDILVCKINPRINRVWVVKHYTDYPLLASSEWIVIRNKEIESNYLKWYFSSPTFRNMLTSQVAGIGGSLTRAQPKQVAKYPVPIPDKIRQKSIISILDKVDNLISLRKQQLAKLDELVKSRFIELFGDVIRNSKAWQMRMFADIASSRLGKMLDAKQQTGKCTYPYLANFNVQWFRFNIENLNQMDFDEDDRTEFELKDGDLLVCEGGEIGRCAVWHNEIQPCFFQKALHRVRCNRQIIHPDYLAWWFKYNCDHGGFAAITGTKATIAHLPGVKLKQLQVVVPPLELQEQFAAFVEQTDKSKLTIQQSLDKLELLKKALMQEYFG
ncbi:MAG: restriction endonuclease subunit S [Butyricicoccaceae bacterium]